MDERTNSTREWGQLNVYAALKIIAPQGIFDDQREKIAEG